MDSMEWFLGSVAVLTAVLLVGLDTVRSLQRYRVRLGRLLKNLTLTERIKIDLGAWLAVTVILGMNTWYFNESDVGMMAALLLAYIVCGVFFHYFVHGGYDRCCYGNGCGQSDFCKMDGWVVRKCLYMSLAAAALPVCLFCGQGIRLWKRGCGRIRRIKRRGERCFQAYRRKFWDWWRDGDFFSSWQLFAFLYVRLIRNR